MQIKTLPKQHAMAWRGKATMQNITQVYMEHGPEAFQYAVANGGEVTGPLFGRYLSFTPEEMELEIGCAVKEPLAGDGSVHAVEIPGGDYACLDYYGPYSGLPGAWNQAHKWLEEHPEWEVYSAPMEVYSAPMEVYWTDPSTEPDQSKWYTEVIHPVRKKA